MKRIIAVVILSMFIAGAACAGTIKCEVTDIIEPILPEGYGSVLVECKELGDIKVGDNVKIKIPKSKTAVEGC